MNTLNKDLQNATFDQLVEIFEGFEASGQYYFDIEMAIMDRMEAVDEARFIEWANEQNDK